MLFTALLSCIYYIAVVWIKNDTSVVFGAFTDVSCTFSYSSMVNFLNCNFQTVWFSVTYLTGRLHTSRSAVFDFGKR